MLKYRVPRKFAATIVALSLLAVGACDDDDDVTGPDELSDGNVVAIAMAANTGEVVTSEPAAEDATRAEVRQFAQMMITDHTAANQRLQALGIAPAPNALSQQLTQLATQFAATLEQLEGEALDSAYTSIQVQLHRTALDTLEDTLIPEAESGALRAELQAMRQTVAAHLERAEDIRDDT